MNVFVDTNVIADWLIPSNSFHTEATELMRLCIQRKVNAFVSSHSLADLFYITRKYFRKEERRKFIRLLVSRMTVIAEDNGIFSVALDNQQVPDFEDALQIACAERERLDFIVTQNLKDFSFSEVPVLSISAMLEKIGT